VLDDTEKLHVQNGCFNWSFGQCGDGASYNGSYFLKVQHNTDANAVDVGYARQHVLCTVNSMYTLTGFVC